MTEITKRKSLPRLDIRNFNPVKIKPLTAQGGSADYRPLVRNTMLVTVPFLLEGCTMNTSTFLSREGFNLSSAIAMPMVNDNTVNPKDRLDNAEKIDFTYAEKPDGTPYFIFEKNDGTEVTSYPIFKINWTNEEGQITHITIIAPNDPNPKNNDWQKQKNSDQRQDLMTIEFQKPVSPDTLANWQFNGMNTVIASRTIIWDPVNSQGITLGSNPGVQREIAALISPPIARPTTFETTVPTKGVSTVVTTTPEIPTSIPIPMIEVKDSQGNAVSVPDILKIATDPAEINKPENVEIVKTFNDSVEEFVNAFVIIQDGETPEAFQARKDAFLKETIAGLKPELNTGVDGKQFVVLTTEDLTATANFDESNTPLMIAEQGENGEWGWKKIRLNAPNKYGITVTTHIESSSEFWNEDGFWQNGGSTGQFVAENYSGVAIPFFWHQIYSVGETGDYNLSKAYVKLTNGIKNPELIGGSLLYGEFVPEWLKSMPVEKQHQIMLDKITEMMTTFPQVKDWIVVNEPLSYGDYWYKTFGKQYIIDAFKKARELNPSANLILNGLDLGQSNNLQTISNESIIIPLIQDLKDQGLIDEVGIEAHIDASKRIPTESELIQYFQSVHEKTGLPVRISELDVDIRSFTSTDRFQKQASIYELIIRTYIKSGVGTNINTWGIKDRDSWRENPTFGGSKNADADLFDDQGNPKAAYFAVLKALFSSNP